MPSGIAARPGSHYLAAEGAADYVSAVGEVLRDPHEDLVRRQHAWDLAQQSYSWSSLPSRLRQLPQCLWLGISRSQRSSR